MTKLPLPMLAAMAALPPLAVDMYLPAIPGIAANLGTDINTVQISLSIFLLGFGIGLLLWGPCSDRFGRRPLAILGLTGFCVSSFLISISDSSSVFLILRLLQGFLGSAASVVVPAMIRDTYGIEAAKGLSAVAMITMLAPLIAPLLGSFLLTLDSWPLIFQSLSLYSLLLGLFVIKFLPETKPGNEAGHSINFFKNYKIILGRRSIYHDLCSLILVAIAFFTYLTSVSFIYITWFGVSESRFGILFACSPAALILANYVNMRHVARIGSRRMLQAGLSFGTVAASTLLLISLLDLSVLWTVLCFVVLIFGMGISYVSLEALILIEFPNHAGSAAAVTGTFRYGFGALAGPLLAMIYTGTPVPVAGLILFCVVGVVILQLHKALQPRNLLS